jgi:hypothetical protein
MKFVTGIGLLGLTFVAAAVAACGSHSASTDSNVTDPSGSTGQVGMRLTLPGGVSLSTVNYSITGPTPEQGSVDVSSSDGIAFVVGGLQAGNYSIQLTATDSNAGACSGSSNFAVSPGTVTGVSLAMQCIDPTDAVAPAPVNSGSVFVDAGVTVDAASPAVCPGITSLTVLPAEVLVGKSSTVAVATIGGAPTVQWTQSVAPGQTGAGTFANATAATTTFTCTQAGQVLVNVSVATGACVGVPFTTMFAVVTCDANTSDAGADGPSSDASDGSTVSACAKNNGGLGCTPTEQLFVQADSTGACYSCLVANGCLDDSIFADTGHECEDLTGTTQQQECRDTVSCILGAGCATSAVSTCYCGTAGVSTTCQGNPAPGPINGACAQQISTGLGFPLNDGTDVTKNFTDTTRPAGMADQIFQCALSNKCNCP